MSDPQHVIDFRTLEVKEDVSDEEMPTSILERKEKILRNRSIPLVKVQWQRLVRRGNVEIRRRNEEFLSLIVRVTRCKFGGPNSFKEERNCNDPS